MICTSIVMLTPNALVESQTPLFTQCRVSIDLMYTPQRARRAWLSAPAHQKLLRTCQMRFPDQRPESGPRPFWYLGPRSKPFGRRCTQRRLCTSTRGGFSDPHPYNDVYLYHRCF